MNIKHQNILKAGISRKGRSSGTLTPLGCGQYICHGTQGSTLLSVGDIHESPQGAAELRLRLRGRGIDPRSIQCVAITSEGGSAHRGILRNSLSGSQVSNFPAARHVVLKGTAGTWKDAMDQVEEVDSNFEIMPGLKLGEAGVRTGVARLPKINLGGAGNRPRLSAMEFATAA